MRNRKKLPMSLAHLITRIDSSWISAGEVSFNSRAQLSLENHLLLRNLPSYGVNIKRKTEFLAQIKSVWEYHLIS